jgi:hypothetical protein
MNSLRQIFSKYTALVAVAIAVAAVLLRTSPASAAGNCLKDLYGKNVQCTANDVRIAQAVNPRDLSGNPINTCFQGVPFSFIVDFQVVTTATARENIGLYLGTTPGGSALTGTCNDNIISPLHLPNTSGTPPPSCPAAGAGIQCLGSALYHEFDTSLNGDNCGDTTSADGTNQFVTVELDNVLCSGSGSLVLPDCTSWQQPGGAILCTSNPNAGWPFSTSAIPGSPSKCSCGTVSIPITPISYSISATKTPNPAMLNEPGGDVTYTVGVTNNTSTSLGSAGSVAINQICDDKFGNIATVNICKGGTNANNSCTAAADCPGGTCFAPNACPAGSLCSAPNNVAGTTCASPVSCSLPQSVAAGATVSNLCSFKGSFTATEGSLKDTVTVNGLGKSGAPANAPPANATVIIGEATASVQVSKSLDTANACATVRYKVEVDNTSATGTDETETLGSLSDTSFGDITKVQGNVVGTTCGQTTGQGTLSGSGPGALPASIAAGGKYICEFDGMFCGGLGSAGNSCTTGLEHKNTVNATLTGDETGELISGSTSSSLTVDACFTSTPN